MTEQPTPPLWRVMFHSYDQSSVPSAIVDASDPETGDCLTDRYGYAAEIRAVADAIDREWIDNSLVEIGTVVMISDWLRAEAERAEAGE